MKRTWILALALALPTPAPAEDRVPTPKDKKEAGSYAFGMDMGRTFRDHGVSVDVEQLAQGLRDGMEGRAPPMTEKDLAKALSLFQGELRAKQERKKRQRTAENLADGRAFLEANKAKEGVVTLPSGLQYKVLKAGDGKRPGAADAVAVRYRGTLVDGTEFDSTKEAPATLRVGEVIAGWREALQLMPVGSRWQLFIPGNLAYGEKGAGRLIGPNATLIFEVELVGIR